MDKLLTTKQAAHRLGIHRNTMLQYLNEKRIPGIKLGKSNNSKKNYPWRIKESDLENFINRSNNSEISN